MLPSVMRSLVMAALLAAAVSAQTPDDALASLGRRAAALVSGDNLEFTHKNISTLPVSDAQRIRAQFEKMLRRRVRRNATQSAITLTISENRASFLLIAEVRRGAEHHVLIEPFQTAPPNTRPGLALASKLLWEQDAPILDLILTQDRLHVLSPSRIASYASEDGRWIQSSASDLPALPSRDPRGRMLLRENELRVYLPGVTCRSLATALEQLRCESSSEPFELAGVQVKWNSAGNTLEAEGLPPFIQLSRVGGYYLAATASGGTLLLDKDRRPAGTLEGWTSDEVAPIDAPCASHHFLGLRDATTLQVFELSSGQFTPASEPEALPGPISALWPMQPGVLAIAGGNTSSRHAAYQISVACRP